MTTYLVKERRVDDALLTREGMQLESYCSGIGKVLGLWVVEGVTEGQEVFASQGIPHRQDFTMRMARYDGGVRSLLRFF